MSDTYKELPVRKVQSAPWRVISLPKFPDIPDRKLNTRCPSKDNDGEPAAPPPSPDGEQQYPALSRSSKHWSTTSIDKIVADLNNSDITKVKSQISVTEINDDAQDAIPCNLHSRFGDIAPGKGVTKIYLWRHERTECESKIDLSLLNLDLSDLTSTSSIRSSAMMSHEDGSTQLSGNRASEAGTVDERNDKTADAPKKRETRRGNTTKPDDHNNNPKSAKQQSNGPTEEKEESKKSKETLLNEKAAKDFQVILKHALSHGPIMAKYNPTSGHKSRSMTFNKEPRRIPQSEIAALKRRILARNELLETSYYSCNEY